MSLTDYKKPTLDLRKCVDLQNLVLRGDLSTNLLYTPSTLTSISVNGNIGFLNMNSLTSVTTVDITNAQIKKLLITNLPNAVVSMKSISMVSDSAQSGLIEVSSINQFSLSKMTSVGKGSNIILQDVHTIVIDDVKVKKQLSIDITYPITSFGSVSITNFKFDSLNVCYPNPYKLENGELNDYKGPDSGISDVKIRNKHHC
jgi:hypothetical protein